MKGDFENRVSELAKGEALPILWNFDPAKPLPRMTPEQLAQARANVDAALSRPND